MDSGADDLVVGQASQPAHSLGEEGRKLAGIDSVSLLPHFAQSGGFRIESKLDFSHLGGIEIDMLLTQLHLKRSCRCLPSADHSDGALSSFQATSLITRLRTQPPWYLGTFCGLVSHYDTQKVPRDFV